MNLRFGPAAPGAGKVDVSCRRVSDSHLAARAHLGRLHRRSFLGPRSRRQAFRRARPGLLLSKPFENLARTRFPPPRLDSFQTCCACRARQLPHSARGSVRECMPELLRRIRRRRACLHTREKPFRVNTLVASDPLPQLRLWRHSYRAPLKRAGRSGFRSPFAIKGPTGSFIQFG